MPVPRRDRRWIWAGRAVTLVILAGLGWYFWRVGWERATVIAGVVGLFAGLIALVAPYLLPVPQPEGEPMPEPDQVEDSGNATATAGGQANTGTQTTGRGGPAQVRRSGDAVADGTGSVANTGIQHQPDPGP
jgi:hypothetical protein